ncbi:MAG: vanadium-dependent haloperoxidase, partial [Steroidobacteraceae bacterium]
MAAAVYGVLLSTTALSANDPVLEWNSIMLSTTAGQNPVVQARFAAITQLAVFEAVNAIDKDFDPYLGTVAAPGTASTEAAAVAAAHAVLKNYFPANASALEGARAASLARITDGIPKQEGIAVGEAAAAAMIALRTADGSGPAEFHVPASAEPGEWQLTPSCPPAGGVLLQWRNLRPFAIETTDQFRSAPPPALTSKRYARDYNEVKRLGGVDSPFRPQDRADVARFYAATAPVPVWNAAASQIAVEQGRSMSENARALALLNMAISDAQASVFETKYHYDFWRPETAIRAGDTDGNLLTRADPDFTPFVLTPCFPSYGSGHGSSS